MNKKFLIVVFIFSAFFSYIKSSDSKEVSFELGMIGNKKITNYFPEVL